ncbi:MAG: hypothetical protein Tsb0014_22840 [Pleurocapsa sp.]
MFRKSLGLTTLALLTSFAIKTDFNSASAYAIEEINASSPQPNYLAQAKNYQVKLGDTLSGIGHKFGLTIPQLININPKLRSRPNLIYVGELIHVSTIVSSVTQPTKTTPTQSRRTTVFGNLPNERRSGSDRIGAKRGNDPVCTANKQEQMKALLPKNSFGWTLYDYPQFFWYFPQLESPSIPVVFLLGEVERTEVDGKIEEKFSEMPYEAELNIKEGGIVSFTLPPDAEPLEEGKEYDWRVEVHCTKSTTMSISGRIKRLSTDNPELSEKLANAPLENYSAILAEAGVWYDALQTMTGLMRESPNDELLKKDWHSVLRMIEFEELADQPLQFIDPYMDTALGE